jgi:hypothetical protein
VVESLAGQLGIADASVLKLYAQRGQTAYEHAAEISAVYGYVDFADPARHEELKLFLSARAWTSAEGPVRLFERAAVWLRERKVLLSGVSTLTRLVSEVRAGSNDRIDAVLVDAAGPALTPLEHLNGVREDIPAVIFRSRPHSQAGYLAGSAVSSSSCGPETLPATGHLPAGGHGRNGTRPRLQPPARRPRAAGTSPPRFREPVFVDITCPRTG